MPAPTELAGKKQKQKTGMTAQRIFLGQQINKRLKSVVSLSPHVEGHHNLELQSMQLEPPARQRSNKSIQIAHHTKRAAFLT